MMNSQNGFVFVLVYLREELTDQMTKSPSVARGRSGLFILARIERLRLATRSVGKENSKLSADP